VNKVAVAAAMARRPKVRLVNMGYLQCLLRVIFSLVPDRLQTADGLDKENSIK
jgi:hypothetical protein